MAQTGHPDHPAHPGRHPPSQPGKTLLQSAKFEQETEKRLDPSTFVH